MASALSITGGAVAVTGAVAMSGALTQAGGTTLSLGSGDTLTLSGTGSSLAGTIAGAGSTLAFAGGTQAINAGAALTVSDWSMTGGTATVNTALTYAGTLTEAAGATLAVATGQRLTLTGADSFLGVVDGAGTLKASGAVVSGLTIGGTASFVDASAVSQTGAVTLGDRTNNGATLTVSTGATWSVGGDFGIALGHSKQSLIRNSGTIVKSGGTGLSVIAPKTIDSVAIVAATGTLDVAGALTGTGSLTVNAGATLEAASSAASTLSAAFSGVGGTLALGRASKFAATITGFAAGDTIDLVKTKATAATLGAGDTLAITSGTRTVATLQLAGDYTGATFAAVSDGNGGTAITVSGPGSAPPPPATARPTPPAIPFISAMAGMGTGAAAGAGRCMAWPRRSPRPDGQSWSLPGWRRSPETPRAAPAPWPPLRVRGR